MRSIRLVAAGGMAALLLTAACRPVQDEGPRYGNAVEGALKAAAPQAETKTATQAPTEAASKTATRAGSNVSDQPGAQLAVAPPPFSEDIFPCSQCHFPDDKVNRVPHEVAFHENIVLAHDEHNRWCLDCHDAQNRDMLHLADGSLVDFRVSYRLCGQCHGPTLRNWRAGEHGKRTGSWSGDKQYLLCANCHNPHSPAFKSLEPLPPPKRQETVR